MKKFLLSILVLLFLIIGVNAETFTTALSKAYKNNSELNAERENINISEQELKVSQGNYLPTVTLSGSKSQEEFFHVFNRLQEDGRQIVLTCDRYPKEIQGLEERLESRFVWGMTAAVEPPELETRVAILLKKAEREAVYIPSDAAFFIAERVRSNVRELEGALRRVIANARFAGRPISIRLVSIISRKRLPTITSSE